MLSVQILDTSTNSLTEAEILLAEGIRMPLKKDGWNFNWKYLVRGTSSEAYVLRTIGAKTVEGVLLLKIVNEMLVMDVIEIAPHNVGRKDKRYDYVAGCLIAFACRKSFEIPGDYRGFLTFESKTNLIDWYIHKYGAENTKGHRMYISPEKGEDLINSYLVRPI